MSESKRQAYRYNVACVDACALLRTSEGEMAVQLVDESAGGFGVICDRTLDASVGEIAGLTTNKLQSIVRITRVEFDENGHTSIGLQRISEVAEEPHETGKRVFSRWVGRGFGSLALIVTFGLGMGVVTAFTGGFAAVGISRGASKVAIPKDTTKRAAALAESFTKLDSLSSRQFIAALKLTDGQQRKIDTVIGKLMTDLKNVDMARKGLQPETSMHVGLLMIRQAWLQVEGVMTEEQMAMWDSILDGETKLPGDSQARR